MQRRLWSWAALLSVSVFALLACASGEPARSSVTPTSGAVAVTQLQGVSSSPWEVALSWTQDAAEGPLTIVSCRAFRQGLGGMVHLIGEVQNTGDQPLRGVTITAEGTSLGTVLDTQTGLAFLDPIAPGERAPFKLFFDMREVTQVTIYAKGEATDGEPVETLEVSDVMMTPPASGYVHIKGQVKNTLSRPLEAVRLVALVRDASGDILDVVESTLPGPMEAGASKPFDVLIMHRDALHAEVRAEAKVGAQ